MVLDNRVLEAEIKVMKKGRESGEVYFDSEQVLAVGDWCASSDWSDEGWWSIAHVPSGCLVKEVYMTKRTAIASIRKLNSCVRTRFLPDEDFADNFGYLDGIGRLRDGCYMMPPFFICEIKAALRWWETENGGK